MPALTVPRSPVSEVFADEARISFPARDVPKSRMYAPAEGLAVGEIPPD
jgi:hypothetical protein